MNAVAWFLVAVLVAFVAVLLGNNAGPRLLTAEQNKAISDCTNKGIAYFSKLGSFPNLSDGRSAQMVALENCRNSIYAFDDLQ